MKSKSVVRLIHKALTAYILFACGSVYGGPCSGALLIKKEKNAALNSPAADQGSSANGFYFGPGFDPTIKARILANLFRDPGSHCYGESNRWRMRLVRELGIPASDIALRSGGFVKHLDINWVGGHFWLLVRGVIFDSTAFQYEDAVPPSEITIDRYVNNPRYQDEAESYPPGSPVYDLNPRP